MILPRTTRSLNTKKCFHCCHWKRNASSAAYKCDLDEEPLGNYKPGGYHPVRIGDGLGDGRYRVLHKVGWGGFSTVWAARDQETNTNVALKIIQAAASGETRGLKTLRYLRDLDKDHVGASHLVRLRGEFDENGPNGKHRCIVLDLTGPSIQDYMIRHVPGYRLPANLAKRFARQTLQALSYLHKHTICHGDLHNQNLAIGIPSLVEADEQRLLEALGEPITARVEPTTGTSVDKHVPPYQVKSCAFAKADALDLYDLKLVDFGASFRPDSVPSKLLNPPVIRPPEAFFGDKLDFRVDLWSMGCTLFELISGQTPFEQGAASPDSILKQMLYLVQDDIPKRWQAKARQLRIDPAKSPASTLKQWLGVIYFESEEKTDLSREAVEHVGDLVTRLLRFEPRNRATADAILEDAWLSGD